MQYNMLVQRIKSYCRERNVVNLYLYPKPMHINNNDDIYCDEKLHFVIQIVKNTEVSKLRRNVSLEFIYELQFI